MQFTRVNGVNLAYYVTGTGFPVLIPEVPTPVIRGDADPLVPYVNGKILAERIRRARLVTLHGCGHLAMWEQPAGLSGALLDFLN